MIIIGPHILVETKMKSVLVVEQSHIQRRMLRIALATHNIPIIEAENGLKGFQMLNSKIKLVVCDLNTPIIDGVEFLTRKSKTKFADIPVIMISTQQPPELKELCYELGAKGWLTKPFSIDDLIVTIESYFV